MTHFKNILASVAISTFLIAPVVFADNAATQPNDGTTISRCGGRGGRHGASNKDGSEEMGRHHGKRGRRGYHGHRKGGEQGRDLSKFTEKMKTELNLTESQTAILGELTDARQANRENRKQQRDAFKQHRGQNRPDLITLGEQRIQRMEGRLEQKKANHNLFRAFYESLSEEQKTTMSSFRQGRGRSARG